MADNNVFHYGYDPEAQEFILWKKSRQLPVAHISRADALAMASTVLHVESNRAKVNHG